MPKKEGSITFTQEVKTEIAQGIKLSEKEIDPENPNDKVSSLKTQKLILSGLTRLSSTPSIGSNPSLKYKTPNSKVARLIYEMLKNIYGLSPTFVYERQMHFDKSIVYVVRIQSKEVYDVLDDLKVMKNLRYTPLRSVLNQENIRNFTKGLFLASGVVNSPKSNSYFLQITMNNEDDAINLCESLNKTEFQFPFKVKKNKNKWMVYLKRSFEISDFLKWIGATNLGMAYENERVTRDYYNNINRWNICDAANFSKTMKTSERNINDINIVLKHKPLSSFSPKHQAIIQYRLNNKEASYGEIANALISQGFSVTKSMVARLFSQMSEEAQNITKSKKSK